MNFGSITGVALLAVSLAGCAVVDTVGAVGSVAGSVVSTTVGVTGDVVGGAVHTVAGSDDED
jgi:hypothetical protein